MSLADRIVGLIVSPKTGIWIFLVIPRGLSVLLDSTESACQVHSLVKKGLQTLDVDLRGSNGNRVAANWHLAYRVS